MRRLEEDEEALAAARENLRRLQLQHADDVQRLENEKRKHAEDAHKASQVQHENSYLVLALLADSLTH